jgi:group I intron endonuclease
MNIRANIPNMNLIGVYSILNTITGKRYVGSTAISFDARLKQHLTLLNTGKHTSRHLQSSWNKHGESAFEFVVEEICGVENVLIREQYFLDYYKSYDDRFGYNILPKAGSHLGAKRTEESKKKMGAWKRLPELCSKLSELSKKNFTPEMKEKLLAASRGRIVSDETRAKMKAGHARARSNPEVIARMATAQLGKKHSSEHIEKCRLARIGKHHSPEWNEKIRISNLGKKRSPEVCAKISAAQKGRKLSPQHSAKLHSKNGTPEVEAKRIASLKKTVALRKQALALN